MSRFKHHIPPLSKTGIQAELTLELVEQNFIAWRARRSKRERLPEELKSQALSLVGRYPLTRIVTTLGLSYMRFRQDCEAAGIAISRGKIVQPLQSRFVEVAQEVPNSHDVAIPVEVQRPDGMILRLNLSSNVVASVLNQFLGGTPC
jgi:hypothetical protein